MEIQWGAANGEPPQASFFEEWACSEEGVTTPNIKSTCVNSSYFIVLHSLLAHVGG